MCRCDVSIAFSSVVTAIAISKLIISLSRMHTQTVTLETALRLSTLVQPLHALTTRRCST